MKLLSDQGFDIDFAALVEKLGTPFFLFQEKVLKERYQTLSDALVKHYPHTRIYYSAKTNFSKWVLRSLRGYGSNVEIACGQELLAARRAGFEPQQICFDGPVKVADDIRYALQEGIGYFYFDSLEDAKRVSAIAVAMGKKVKSGFRIHPRLGGFLSGAAEFYITKFGIPIEKAVEIYQEAQQLPNLELEAISSHIGSQIISVRPYLQLVDQLTRLAILLTKQGFTIHEINLGGGFPSGTLIKTTPFNFALRFLGVQYRHPVPELATYAEEIAKRFGQRVESLALKPVLATEPGRSFASQMGILVSRVSVLKEPWVILDASKYFIPESIFFEDYMSHRQLF